MEVEVTEFESLKKKETLGVIDKVVSRILAVPKGSKEYGTVNQRDVDDVGDVGVA